MKPRTVTETAIICAASVLAVALVTIPFELSPNGVANHNAKGVVSLALAGVVALGFILGFRYLTIRKGAQIELVGSQQYRNLADEYRRLADMAITAQEHTDLRLSHVSAQLDHLREQNESLQKILKEVE